MNNTMTRLTLGQGIALTCMTTEKFKSSCMSATLSLPLAFAPAAPVAMLPGLLRRGTARYPTMQQLSARLDELYGARIEPVVRKVGETLSVGFLSDVIDSCYAAQGEDLVLETAALLGELITDPYLDGDSFCPDYFASEKKNHQDLIAGRINDKRLYAVYRLYSLMCQGEAFGLSELGESDQLEGLTPGALTGLYRSLLKSAPIELFYCGSQPAERVAQAFTQAFGQLSRENILSVGTVAKARPDGPVRQFVDEMQVGQGKLAMGARTGITGGDAEYPALMLFNAVFGGGTSSKLFNHVREELSLCYYASSVVEKTKGILTISSGIETEKKEQVEQEILRQWEDIRQGRVTEEELSCARRTVVGSLRAMADSPLLLERYWNSQAIAGQTTSPEELIDRVERVTKEQVVAAACRAQLDSVYFLKGVAKND